MTDPLGLIGRTSPVQPPATPAVRPGQESGPGFKTFLQEQIEKVNQLQTDAQSAAEDLMAGRRNDFESVIVATQKADLAFKALMQVRNKMMDAYEEVKQMRV